jgi:hypothetical protein
VDEIPTVSGFSIAFFLLARSVGMVCRRHYSGVQIRDQLAF